MRDLLANDLDAAAILLKSKGLYLIPEPALRKADQALDLVLHPFKYGKGTRFEYLSPLLLYIFVLF
ncbi:hypothetical protein YC2023_020802 [Brassica napus]